MFLRVRTALGMGLTIVFGFRREVVDLMHFIPVGMVELGRIFLNDFAA